LDETRAVFGCLARVFYCPNKTLKSNLDTINAIKTMRLLSITDKLKNKQTHRLNNTALEKTRHPKKWR